MPCMSGPFASWRSLSPDRSEADNSLKGLLLIGSRVRLSETRSSHFAESIVSTPRADAQPEPTEPGSEPSPGARRVPARQAPLASSPRLTESVPRSSPSNWGRAGTRRAPPSKDRVPPLTLAEAPVYRAQHRLAPRIAPCQPGRFCSSMRCRHAMLLSIESCEHFPGREDERTELVGSIARYLRPACSSSAQPTTQSAGRRVHALRHAGQPQQTQRVTCPE